VLLVLILSLVFCFTYRAPGPDAAPQQTEQGTD